MKDIDLAISNIEHLSQCLEKVSVKAEYLNSDYGYYLEQMSWGLHKQAQDLKQLKVLWG